MPASRPGASITGTDATRFDSIILAASVTDVSGVTLIKSRFIRSAAVIGGLP